MNKSKVLLIIFIIVATIVTCINPVYPHEQFLQHAGTVLLLIPLFVDLRHDHMPMSAFVGLVLFTLFHVIGARYMYSYVPYKEWLTSFGIVGTDYFQDPRNHYDRLVHFLFGITLFPYFIYLCRNILPHKHSTATFMAWLIIQTGSMIYELFEWTLTIVMTSEEADYYNGQQGDIWDAQKDMALALLGSTIMLVYYLVKFKLQAKHLKNGF